MVVLFTQLNFTAEFQLTRGNHSSSPVGIIQLTRGNHFS